METNTQPVRLSESDIQKNAGLILATNATFYLLYSCIQAALAPVVMLHYGLDSFEAGLCYLPYGTATIAYSYLVGTEPHLIWCLMPMGHLTLTLGAGKMMDFDYKVTAKSHGIIINTTSGDDKTTFPIERTHLRSMPYYLIVYIFSAIGFVWSVEKGAHLSVPMVMLFLCGIATTGVFIASIFYWTIKLKYCQLSNKLILMSFLRSAPPSLATSTPKRLFSFCTTTGR